MPPCARGGIGLLDNQLEASNGTSWTISCGVKLAKYSVVTLP
jgi:hypothetical protein